MLNKPSMIICLLAIAALLITAVLTIAVLLPSKPVSAPLVIDPLPQIILNGDREATVELTGSGFDQSLQVWITPDVSDRQAILSSLSTYGRPWQLVIRNQHAYIANGPSGVMIVDISDRKSPTVLSSIKLPGLAIQLDVREKVTLVAGGKAGLHLLDLNDVTAPRLLSTLTTIGPAIAVASQNQLAFVSCGENGLQVIDFSDLLTPRSVGTLKLPGKALDLAIHKHTLIVALEYNLGIAVLDISVPTSPRLISRLRLDGYIGNNSLAFHDDYALVALFNVAHSWGSGSLYAIDLTIPTQPRTTSVVPIDGRPRNLTWSDRHATLSLGANGLSNFDLSDPARPRLESSLCPPGYFFYATRDDDTIWATDGVRTLSSLDPNHSSNVVQSARIPDVAPRARSLIADNRLYVVDRAKGLAIYDVAEQNHPVLLSTYPVNGTIETLMLHQKTIFLGIENNDRSGNLLVIDLTSLANPQLLATLSLPQIPLTVGMIDNTLVLAVAKTPMLVIGSRQCIDTLMFIDVSVPCEPRVVSEYPLNTAVSNFALDADHRFSLMSEQGIFQIIDFQDPLHPILLGKLEMPWIEQSAWNGQRGAILFHNKIALVPTSVDKIRLIDLEDPLHPTEFGSIATGGVVISMALTDNLLLASIKDQGTLLIDLQNRLQPQRLGVLPLPGTQQWIIVDKEQLWYFFEYGSGIFSARMPQRLEATLTKDGDCLQIKIPTKELTEGDYSLWFSTRENLVEQPAMIRYRKG